MADQPAAPPPPDPGPPAAAEPPPVIYASRPPDAADRVLAERFFEGLADQGKQMDELARQMIAVELAVPGLYASILALLRGQDATLPDGRLVVLTFGCWLAALALSFAALFPRRYRVDPTLVRGAPADAGALSLEAFFDRSAAWKRRLLAIAAAVFWAGIAAAVWLLFTPPTP